MLDRSEKKKVAKSVTLDPRVVQGAEKESEFTGDSVSAVISRWAMAGMRAAQARQVAG